MDKKSSLSVRGKIATFIKAHWVGIFLGAILLFSFGTKLWRLSYPNAYVFDEVYAGFTAEQYAQNNVKAWVWDYPAPKGFAFNWDHPPLGRIIMSLSIRALGQSSFSRRVMPLIAGVLVTFMVFKLAQILFPKQPFLWLMAAFLSSLDGLLLVLSRTGLVDTILTLFIICCVYFMLRGQWLLAAIFFGAASSVKWTGLYLFGFILIVLVTSTRWNKDLREILKNLFYIAGQSLAMFLIASLVYLGSYNQVFIHYGIPKFIELQQQQYWYHSHLKATHPAQSPALSWPILYKPVWFYVDYGKDTTSNIYALGNPIIFWGGVLAFFFTLGFALQKKQAKYWYLLLAYLCCWTPWIFSPRIMFLYHYLPAIPFLCIILAFTLETIRKSDRQFRLVSGLFVLAALATFIYFFPYWTGLPVPKDQVTRFQWLETWK